MKSRTKRFRTESGTIPLTSDATGYLPLQQQSQRSTRLYFSAKESVYRFGIR
jgi:4'-phosphopantetheinyl transferase EntD